MQEDIGIALLQWCLGQDSGYVAIGSKHSRTRAWKETFFPYPSDLDAIQSYISSRGKNSDLYFCPTILRSTKRNKDNIAVSSVLWADLDTCEPAKMLVKPTIVVETSPGSYQAYWGLHSSQPALDVEEYNRRIARYHKDDGCDQSGWDLTQYLRIPGTDNFKPEYLKRYLQSPTVKIIDVDWSRKYDLTDFDVYPAIPGQTKVDVPLPVENDTRTAEDILNSTQVMLTLHPNARELFETPLTGTGWSEKLWALELYLFNAGLSAEEVFIVCKEAACNKYARDNRPDDHLWKEVCRAKAHLEYQDNSPSIKDDLIDPDDLEVEKIYIPRRRLLTEEERAFARSRKTFVEEYIEWGKTCTDAPAQYHEGGAFIILSSVLSGNIRIPTSAGTLIPNLWVMMLGDTTLSRKSTCMGLAMSLLSDIDPDCVLATDGSVEGIMDGLSVRPRRSSIFLKDEFSGFLEKMVKRDFLGGIMEDFTQLYDGRDLKRMLRSGPIAIREPVFILYGGGIKDRIYQWMTNDYISSGFVPRFIFISPPVDRTKLKALGPPTQQNLSKRAELTSKLHRINAHYSPEKDPSETDDPNIIVLDKLWNVELSPEAWEKYNSIANTMEQMAADSDISEILIPMMDRLSKSGLKAAALIAAAERMNDDIVVHKNDIIHAFSYIERWIEYSFEVATNSGKSADERTLDQVSKFIATNPGVSRGKIMRRFHLNARIADGIFATLRQRGLVTMQRASNKGEIFYPVRVIKRKEKEEVTFT